MTIMTTRTPEWAYDNPNIEHPQAYAKAVRSKIMAGANAKFLKSFDRAEEVMNFLKQYNCESAKPSFLKSMAEALFENYGKLTESQYQAVCKTIDKVAESRAKYAQALAEQKAKSAFVGVENEKVMVTVKVAKVLRMSAPSFSYYDRASQEMYIMTDDAGNTYVYRTKSFFEYKFPKKQLIDNSRYSNGNSYGLICDTTVMAGMTITMEATVKAHVEYKGEKQTIITRPKILGMEWAVADIKPLVDLQDR
jgi:hypothetical protein